MQSDIYSTKKKRLFNLHHDLHLQLDGMSAYSYYFSYAAALTLPFILSKQITFSSPTFLTAVAAHSFQIRSAVLLSFVGSALTVYLGITAFQVLRLYSKLAALLFVVVCAVSCTLDVVQGSTIMSIAGYKQCVR